MHIFLDDNVSRMILGFWCTKKRGFPSQAWRPEMEFMQVIFSMFMNSTSGTDNVHLDFFKGSRELHWFTERCNEGLDLHGRDLRQLCTYEDGKE